MASPSARARLVLAAVLLSTAGTAIKLTAFSGWQVICLRSAIAALTLSFFLSDWRRAWSWRTPLVGAAYAATIVSFVLATRLTTAAQAVFLQSAAPLYLLLGNVALRRPVRRADAMFALTVVAGIAIVFIGTDAATVTAPNPLAGNILATISGMTLAATIGGLRWIGAGRQGSAGATLTAILGDTFACMVALPLALPLPSPSLRDWLVVVYLGVFQVGLSYRLIATAIPRVPAIEASTILLLEVALVPLWASLALRETPGIAVLVGGSIVLAALLTRARWDARAGGS